MAPHADADAPHNSFDTILVLDFGSQTSHLILRRLRSLGVFAELLSCTTKIVDLTWKPKGIVFSGGPASVYDEASPLVFEYGHADIKITKVNSNVDHLFAGLGEEVPVFMSHYDKLVTLPEVNEQSPVFAERPSNSNRVSSLLVPPITPNTLVSPTRRSSSSTPCEIDILRNFNIDICGAQANWVMGNFVQLEIARIRELVGDRALVLGVVSGDVDNTVAAALMTAAMETVSRYDSRVLFTNVHLEQLAIVYLHVSTILIDIGCMRLNECEEVKQTLGKHLNINLTVVEAGELFMSRFADVSDPEKKRKIIGSFCEYSPGMT
ncbi:unnamed protein product [Penicillium salamii]|uniref:GMPS ATP-PPase domain-containing protein n=1 Tax=Penicillium salamii TaxID=1612424 RepID=A0A9W4IV35_9EURO|nr:unnamed protein product [Penicillium salamii]